MSNERRALAIAARVKLHRFHVPCADHCPGWEVVYSALRGGFFISSCADCWAGAPAASRLTDEEAAALPEAQKLLRDVAKEEGLPIADDGFGAAVHP